MMRMDQEARARLLNFVTCCPHLPPAGLTSLTISVQAADTRLPTAHTCTATLRLPAYADVEALEAAFATAFANTSAGGLHELR